MITSPPPKAKKWSNDDIKIMPIINKNKAAILFQSDKEQHIKHDKIPGLNGLKLIKECSKLWCFLIHHDKLKSSQMYFLKHCYETTFYIFHSQS